MTSFFAAGHYKPNQASYLAILGLLVWAGIIQYVLNIYHTQLVEQFIKGLSNINNLIVRSNYE